MTLSSQMRRSRIDSHWEPIKSAFCFVLDKARIGDRQLDLTAEGVRSDILRKLAGRRSVNANGNFDMLLCPTCFMAKVPNTRHIWDRLPRCKDQPIPGFLQEAFNELERCYPRDYDSIQRGSQCGSWISGETLPLAVG
jgi:hypothetical protein